MILFLKVVGILLKYELNELAITSGSLIIMPFSLMEVPDDLRLLQRMVLMLDHTFILFPKELLSGSSSYFSEYISVPTIFGKNRSRLIHIYGLEYSMV